MQIFSRILSDNEMQEMTGRLKSIFNWFCTKCQLTSQKDMAEWGHAPGVIGQMD